MHLYSINTGFFKLDGGAMFGVVPKSIWNKINPADENNLCSWALRCLLIEDGDRLILVDTGLGTKQDAKFFGHYGLHGTDTLDDSLARHGFNRHDITDVILTHLHFDHCGGTIVKEGDRLIAAFPKARVWSNPEHWNWAVQPNDREKASFLKENILPIKELGQLHMIDVPDEAVNGSKSEKQIETSHTTATSAQSLTSLGTTSFENGIDIRFANGHTRAMMLPQIRYRQHTIVFMADLLPSAGHIPLPYVMAYDMFPLTSLQEKRMFLEEAVTNNYVLFFEHDREHECCTLQRTEKGIRPDRFFSLSELD
jgi:glyoxylase-like metal-dependent hydrolase (beta-lactamase superfamily II)